MNNSTQQFTIDDRALLEYLLHTLKITKKQALDNYRKYYALAAAVKTGTHSVKSNKTYDGVELVAHDVLWSTPRAILKTTQYGRIKGAQLRPNKKKSTPQVTVKRRRILEK